MWEYAEGVRALGIRATVLTFDPHPFGYQDDLCLNLSQIPQLWRRRGKLFANFLRAILSYDTLHFHCGSTLLPHYLDLPWLKLLGKKMVVSFWGSEVRLRKVAEENNPYYALVENTVRDDDEIIDRLQRIARYIKVAVVADYELHKYVVPFFEHVIIIPQAIDTHNIPPVFPDPQKHVPLIVHTPSHKGIKGTQYVEQAISRLEKRYRFRFLLLHQMTNQGIKETLEQADVVVDQLLLGAYGVLSVEAMALGKPVLCYIRDDLVDKYPSDLPIVNANPDTIELELEKLLSNPELRTEIGKRSRKFAERHHDSRVVAQKLIELYESL